MVSHAGFDLVQVLQYLTIGALTAGSVQVDDVGAPPESCNPLVDHHPLLVRRVGRESLIEVGANAEILAQQLANIVAGRLRAAPGSRRTPAATGIAPPPNR